jgi:hypothetical protein
LKAIHALQRAVKDGKDRFLFETATVGLILCAKKNETIAKYSVLKDSK